MEAQQEFEGRLVRVRQAMRDKGLQTLLVHDSGRHNFLRMNYVAYLTDFISVGPETHARRAAGRSAGALSLAGVGYSRAQEESWVQDVRPFKEFWSRASKLAGKVGLIGREAMHVDLHDEIAKSLKQTPVNAKDIIETMARSKSCLRNRADQARGGDRRRRRQSLARRCASRIERVRARRHRRASHALPRRRR